jgi:hypothetical protein
MVYLDCDRRRPQLKRDPLGRREQTLMTNPVFSSVQFDATFDELIDIQLRTLSASQVVSSWRRVNRIAMAAVTALVAFLLIQLFPRLFQLSPRATATAGLLGAGAAALISYAMYPLDHKRILRRRLGKLLIEQFGNIQSIRCEIELRRDNLFVRQAGLEIAHSWTTIRGIRDTPDGVEFKFPAGLLMVRSRAFATPAEREQFLSQARGLASEGGGLTCA